MGVTNFSNNQNGQNGTGNNGQQIPGSMFIPVGQQPPSQKQQDPVLAILKNLNDQPHDPIRFRDEILRQLVCVLCKKYKPNALLIGPAGTGKTAIAEELAYMIKTKHPLIPPALQNKIVYKLNIHDITAGTQYRGDLEAKLNEIVDFLSDPSNKAIVFIDEIHQLMMKDSSHENISQILKPALSRGEIKAIGATTVQEAKMLDNDPAFNRRFQRILVDELTKQQTSQILLSLQVPLTKHYMQAFSLTPELADFIVNTADEFQSAGNHRPDNAITLLDDALSNALIDKQAMLNSPDPAVQAAAQAMPCLILSENSIKKTAIRLATGNNEPKEFDEAKFREDFARIKGQDEVLEPLLRMMKRHTAHLRPMAKPLTILMMGASGTGKTEVTKILARNYLCEKPIIINMTEYTHPSDINKIIGSPPGYVGSDDNREMPFDALDTNPYQVILLDEMEKGHPSVQSLFMRVFDEGLLTTAKGKVIDFTKSIIIATTNAGCTNDAQNPIGYTTGTKQELTKDQLIKMLSNYFKIELLNRFTERYKFNSITRDVFIEILKDVYKKDAAAVKELHPRAQLPDELPDDDAEALADKYYSPKFNARPAKEAVNEYIDGIMIP